MNILNKIRNLLFIDISRKNIIELTKNEKINAIVIKRHNVFISKIVLLQILSLILIGIYGRIVFNLFPDIIPYVLTNVSIALFTIRIIFSRHTLLIAIKNNQSIFINSEIKKLCNTAYIEKYISYGIIIIGILYMDIVANLIVQLNSINEQIFWYIVEVIIFIGLIFINKKIIKIYLDFEMDMIIISSGTIQYINREGLYKVEKKLFIGNQIQSIEINQSNILDSILKKGSLVIRTTNSDGNKLMYYSLKPVKYDGKVENDIQDIINSSE